MTRRILPDLPRPDAPDQPEFWETMAQDDQAINGASLDLAWVVGGFIAIGLAALGWWLV